VQRYAAVWSEQSAGIAPPMAAMTVGRGRGKGAIVNQLRFEAGLGHYSVNVAPDSVWIFRGMGTHYFQVQLQIGIPEFGAGAGRLLCVETTLYAPGGQRPAGTARVNERLRPLQPRGRGPDADAAIPHYQRAAAAAPSAPSVTAGKKCQASAGQRPAGAGHGARWGRKPCVPTRPPARNRLTLLPRSPTAPLAPYGRDFLGAPLLADACSRLPPTVGCSPHMQPRVKARNCRVRGGGCPARPHDTEGSL